MNGAKHLFLNLFGADAVGAAGPDSLIGRTDIVDVLFGLGGYCLSDHGLLAIAAEQKAGKQMRFFLIGRAAHIPPQHDLDGHEVFIGDKGFVSVLNLYPLGLVFALHHADFIVGSSAFALCQYANIYFIGEDALDSLVSPLGRFSGLEDCIEPYTG